MADKREGWFFWASMAVIVIFVILLFFYFAMFKFSLTGFAFEESFANPADSMTAEQVAESFNETFVEYLLYSIKANELHNPPLSSDTPKLEILVGGDVYNAVVVDGVIDAGEGPLKNKDVVIRTSKIEAAKMIKDRTYVVESFREELSVIELTAGKTTLFSKGYLNLYTELTGKSITGNVIRIYLG